MGESRQTLLMALAYKHKLNSRYSQIHTLPTNFVTYAMSNSSMLSQIHMASCFLLEMILRIRNLPAKEACSTFLVDSTATNGYQQTRLLKPTTKKCYCKQMCIPLDNAVFCPRNGDSAIIAILLDEIEK